MAGHGSQDADYLNGLGPTKPHDIMKRNSDQTALMHQLLRELPLIENLAMRAGLPITCRAIQNAVRASGWEAAGDTERANYYAPNTEGFGSSTCGVPPTRQCTYPNCTCKVNWDTWEGCEAGAKEPPASGVDTPVKGRTE